MRWLLLVTLTLACKKSEPAVMKMRDPTYIVADASGAYIANERSLVRWHDGKQQVLFEGLPVGAPALDGDDIYYATYDRSKLVAEIRRQPKTGGTAQVIGAGWPLIDIEIDATHVYWKAMSVERVPKGGGTPEQIVESVDPGSTLALDDKHVYFVVGDGSIARVAKSGGTPETLVKGLVNPDFYGLEGDVLWWTERNWQVLKRAPIGGAAKEVQLPKVFVAGFAITPRGVFVSDSTNKKLHRIDSAGRVTTEKTFDDNPGKLAIFGDAIYIGFDREVRRY